MNKLITIAIATTCVIALFYFLTTLITFQPPSVTEGEIERIKISGIGRHVTISSPKPAVLDVSGIKNVVTVPDNVKIIEINLCGESNIVYIPKNANPKVNISGIENQVVKY